MFLHELLDSALIRFDNLPHLGADLLVPGAADLGVPHHALPDVFRERIGPEHFGHGAGRAAIVLEQLLEPVFSLSVTDREGSVRHRRSEYVRDAEFIAIDRCRLVDAPAAPGRSSRYSQNQERNKNESWSRHCTNSSPGWPAGCKEVPRCRIK